MASLIIHGDLSIPGKPLERPLYVRPILNASTNFNGSFSEHIPANVIGVDLVHSAVKRICEGEARGAAVAPTVRIINFSVGDRFRPFDNSISPLARLVDWLSFKYNLLFVISAGNHPSDLELEVGRDDFSSLEKKDLQVAVVKAIAKSMRHRRLLSPAESLNGLTIGAIHGDKSTVVNLGYRFDAFVSEGMPSPLNAIGLGFRRAIKPEIFVPGGRQLFKEKLGSSHKNTIIEIDTSISEPGILVAAPGRIKGELTGRLFTRGTSNATALVTREAAIFLDFIEELRKLPDGQFLSDEYTPALLKAMLVHGAFWSQAADDISKILKTPENSRRIREHLARFIGYGSPNYARVRGATDQRATLIGCGTISSTELKRFILPLPEDLGGKNAWRRLILTLAWLTPVNSSHRLYRGASLSFNPPGKSIQAIRKDVDWRAVQRGTVQHEVLSGDKAIAFKRGETLEVEIACSADAGELSEPIKFALLATLEVDESEKIKIWEGVNEILLEIRERIALRRRI